jgi:hypothetical protein
VLQIHLEKGGDGFLNSMACLLVKSQHIISSDNSKQINYPASFKVISLKRREKKINKNKMKIKL